jgi:flavin reductase (DIM6/NTAB) family NADH-FMN oxidoreductase RutF
VPRSTQAVQADYCGIVSGSDDPAKAATCGWTLLPSRHIASPIIAECPLNLECRVVRQIDDGTAFFCLAEVLETHVDEAALNAKGQPDAHLLDPLIFAPDGQHFALGETRGKAFGIGKSLKKPNRAS